MKQKIYGIIRNEKKYPLPMGNGYKVSSLGYHLFILVLIIESIGSKDYFLFSKFQN